MSSHPYHPAGALTRRDFLQQTAAGAAAAGLALAAGESRAAPVLLPKSKVVVATNPAIHAPDPLDRKAVTATVHKAVCTLFGTEDVAEAFSRIAGKDDLVAIKPNCAGGTKTNSTRLYVVMALTEGLQKAGVPWKNMIVYEQTQRLLKQCGYPIMKKPDNVRVLGVQEHIGYSTRLYEQGKVKQHLAKVLEECSVIINVPFLKTTVGMGVSLAMKNHQGSIDKPRDNHVAGGAPHLADLNMIPVIRQKTKLVLCDATYPLYDGGPGDKPDAHWPFNSVLAATDPVALDALGYHLLEEKRKELDYDPIEDVPAYIKTADMRRQGNGDVRNIERVNVSVTG